MVGDWRIALARPLFILVDLVLKSPLGKVIFERVREKAILRGALEQIYSFKESVDEELVDLFHGPSCDEGAADVFISIYTGAAPVPLHHRRGTRACGETDRKTREAGGQGGQD